MKVLVLGSDGLLGSRIFSELRKNLGLDTIGTSRGDPNKCAFSFTIINLFNLIRMTRPNYIVNCIATTSENSGLIESFRSNSILPISLSVFSKFLGFQVIHFSTNAVYSGRRKRNLEKFCSLPSTQYAFTKAIGDFSFFGSLIIRTSFIGDHESNNKSKGLLLQLKCQHNGEIFYVEEDFYWNGVTADVLVALTKNLILENRRANGIFNFFSAEVLSRHQVVQLILDKLNKEKVTVVVSPQGFNKNLSLETQHPIEHLLFWNLAGYPKVPTFSELVSEMTLFS